MTTLVDLGLLADKSRWRTALCPDCERERPHPLGGNQLCDDCYEATEKAQAAADEERRSFEAAERARAEAESMLERSTRVPQLLAEAGCPTRYRQFTRASWERRWGPWSGQDAGEVTPLIDGWTGETAETWLVLFYGTYGARKTGLATALLGERLVAGKKGLWLDVADWISAMQAGFKNGSSGVLYRQAQEAEVLLLDDLGAVLGARAGRRGEEQTWWKEEVSRLLRHREAWIKPTICTANIMEIQEIGTIDRSLVSRMDVELAFFFPDTENYRISGY